VSWDSEREATIKPRLDDSILIAAYPQMHEIHIASVDDVLVCPLLRNEFLDLVRHWAGSVEQEAVLRRALNMRKRSQLRQTPN
jgi:hypothetical protein